jgi:pimeloyl-ACP methyl ester carboxylesterase
MPVVRTRIFLPGFGARARAYAAGLPSAWTALQPPPPRGEDPLVRYADWLEGELARRSGPTLVAGHSMGGALAILVAARRPDLVAGLVLIAPAGLPLSKPIRASAADFVRQVGSGRHRADDVAASALELVRRPRAALRLVRRLRALDLRTEMERVRDAGVPVTVVSCDTDTLTSPAQCARAAVHLGARHRELSLEGGHVWMFGRWHALATLLSQEDRGRALVAAR